MILEIEVNGRTRTVSVEPVAQADGRFRIVIDGQAHSVDARQVDPSTLSLILLDAGHACHEIELVDSTVPGELLVRTRDGLLRAIVNGRRHRRGSAEGGAGPSGEQRILAPMPGKIVRVLVTAGAEVAARQGLVVVEAMKMESEITSPKAGHVKVVAVEPGMLVEAGRLLCVVE
jgi:biotin carboxyl carrier protein